ncbi:MAG: acyl-CoA thioesterase [Bacteroidales bacterium]|nr:acyl-CoA thioesterase [Bacteroidales bacterium]
MKDNVKLSAEKAIEIRFSEVDMMGVVWHGSYATYLEDAREAFGEKYGLSYTRYIVEYVFAPIVEMDISYKKPLRYGMKPVVRVTYRPTDAAKIIFDYEIVDPEDGTVYLKATTVQVFMDKDYNLMWDSPAFYVDWKKQMGLI